MRVLLLGASGMLGRDIAEAVPSEVTLTERGRADLDVTDFAAVSDCVSIVRPQIIINASGFTAVDEAESRSALAFQVNAAAVGELARLAAREGSILVHFSTDYVFDGANAEPYVEESPPHPVNTYGASKLAGEQALRRARCEHLLLRTQWLFGRHGESFPRTMWRRAVRGLPTTVVADQWGTPTYTPDVARATWRLIALNCRGTYHIANSGITTWFEVAHRVFTLLGKPELVAPIASVDYPTKARRPRYSVLSTTKLAGVLGTPLSSWRLAVADFIAHLEQSAAEN